MRIPVRELLPAQALPAAGAFVASDTFEFPWGTTNLTFYCDYTRGAAGGQPQFEFEIGFSPGASGYRTIVVDTSSLAITTPNASYDIYMEQIDGPAPADGTAIRYIIRLCPVIGERALRMLAREVGDPDNPGDLEVLLTGGGFEQ